VGAEHDRAPGSRDSAWAAHEELGELAPRVRKCAATRVCTRAAFEQRVERVLGVPGRGVVQPDARQRGAAENGGADRRGEEVQVDLRERRTVRGAEEVDLPVAERLPYRLEIVGGDARRVQARSPAKHLRTYAATASAEPCGVSPGHVSRFDPPVPRSSTMTMSRLRSTWAKRVFTRTADWDAAPPGPPSR